MEKTTKENVRIERMGNGAAAIAHLANGKTAFVAGGAPGDYAEIEIIDEKKNYAQARMARLLEAGSARNKTNCPCVIATKQEPSADREQCGGCPWAHLSYETQVEAKRANIIEAFVRTGHIERERAEALVLPCIPGKHTWGYRNKLELGCDTDTTGRLVLGLHEAQGNDLVAIRSCPLANKHIADLPKSLQGALRFASGEQNLGIFRIGIRGSVRTHDVEVALWTKPGPFPRNEVTRVIKSTCKTTSIVRVMASSGKERKVKGVEALSGKGAWEEELRWGQGENEHARFLTSAPSFFQVNSQQAEKLIACALDALRRGGFELRGALVADLYSGGGTFSLPLARAGAEVIAVEAASTSVRDLRRNAEMNQEYIEVVGGDAARELADVGSLDALIVDPPRAGLAPAAIENIVAAQPDRIVYVSCDPQTLARDIGVFAQKGYRLESAQPVDLFPQTYHVETVALLVSALGVRS